MKFLDSIETPQGATHVTIHLDDAGKQGPTLRFKEGETPYEYFAFSLVSRDWIARTWGDGEYRFNFYEFDAAGTKKRIGPRGGSISCRRESPAVAAAPAAPPPDRPLTALEMFAFMSKMHSDAQESADKRANAQIERERMFLASTMSQQQTFMEKMLAASRPPDVDVAEAVRDAVADELAELSAPPKTGEPLTWWQQMLVDGAKKTGDAMAKAADAITEEKVAAAKKRETPAM